MPPRKRLFAVLILLTLMGCGARPFVNPSYRYELDYPPKVAIIPVAGDWARLSDAAFMNHFSRPPRPYELIPIADLRQKLRTDDSLSSLLATIARRAPARADAAHAPNLKELVGETGLTAVRDRLGADLMLYPVRLDLEPGPYRTFGSIQYRLYDLHTGNLILENSRTITANIGGETGSRMVAFGLAGQAYSDFQRHFLPRRRRATESVGSAPESR